MNTAAIHTGPTGPRTESGKATSARNATRNGLYAARDFILDGEAAEYFETLTSLRTQLKPEGVLEETFAAEIMTATWRLRRCRIVEATLATESPNPEALAKEQSIDRARAQSHNLLRRSMAELRRLQTESALRLELHGHGVKLEGLADSRQLLGAIKTWAKSRLDLRKADGLDTLEGITAEADRDLCMKTRLSETYDESVSSFCKSTASAEKLTPRNAECPCGSGAKYKRCCGKNAPPQLNYGGRAA